MSYHFDPHSLEWENNMYDHVPFLLDKKIYWDDDWGMWVVSPHSYCSEILRDEDTFTSEEGVVIYDIGPQGGRNKYGVSIGTRDGESHKFVRKHMTKFFREPFVSNVFKTTSEIIDDFFKRNINDLDISELATLVSSNLCLDLLELPIPELGVEREEIAEWIARIITGSPIAEWDENYQYKNVIMNQLDPMMGQLAEYLNKAIEYRRNNPSDDVISTILNWNHPETTFDQKNVQFIIPWANFILIPNEFVSFLVKQIIFNLVSHETATEQLRNDNSLIKSFIHETLRWDAPSKVIKRVVTRDINFHGVKMKKDDIIAVFTAGANRDPDVFFDPNRFDINRDNNMMHLALATGPHRCIASIIVYGVAEILINKFIQQNNQYTITDFSRLCTVTGNARGIKNIHLKLK